MTGERTLLSEFVEKAGPGVSYGDDSIGRTLGYGSIVFGIVIIENVALVEGLKHNLLSVSQLTYRDVFFNFQSSHCEVQDNHSSKVVLKAYKKFQETQQTCRETEKVLIRYEMKGPGLEDEADQEDLIF